MTKQEIVKVFREKSDFWERQRKLEVKNGYVAGAEDAYSRNLVWREAADYIEANLDDCSYSECTYCHTDWGKKLDSIMDNKEEE
jgi:hypothetical protein